MSNTRNKNNITYYQGSLADFILHRLPDPEEQTNDAASTPPNNPVLQPDQRTSTLETEETELHSEDDYVPSNLSDDDSAESDDDFQNRKKPNLKKRKAPTANAMPAAKMPKLNLNRKKLKAPKLRSKTLLVTDEKLYFLNSDQRIQVPLGALITYQSGSGFCNGIPVGTLSTYLKHRTIGGKTRGQTYYDRDNGKLIYADTFEPVLEGAIDENRQIIKLQVMTRHPYTIIIDTGEERLLEKWMKLEIRKDPATDELTMPQLTYDPQTRKKTINHRVKIPVKKVTPEYARKIPSIALTPSGKLPGLYETVTIPALPPEKSTVAAPLSLLGLFGNNPNYAQQTTQLSSAAMPSPLSTTTPTPQKVIFIPAAASHRLFQMCNDLVDLTQEIDDPSKEVAPQNN